MKFKLIFFIVLLLGITIGAFYFYDFFQAGIYFPIDINARFLALAALSLFLMICGHVLRAYKSKLLLDKIRPSKTKLLFKGLSVGYLFNTILPLRIGELIRAYYVGDALHISKTAAFVSIIIERVVDGFILSISFLFCSFITRSNYPEASQLFTKFGLILFGVSTLLAVFLVLIKQENKYFLRSAYRFSSIFNAPLSDRIRFMIWSGTYGTRLMLENFKNLLLFTLLSILMWSFYIFSVLMVVLAYFGNIGFTRLFAIIQSVFAGVSIPSGPGYVGTFHEIVSDVVEKVELRTFTGFSLIAWVILFLPIALIGLYVLIRHRLGERSKENTVNDAFINKLYRDRDISTELSHFLEAYLKGEEINKLLTRAELDGKFRLIKAFKGGSNAQTMLVWQEENLYVKKITLSEYADKLKDQAEWLKSRHKIPNLPRVLKEEEDKDYYYFDLEYRENYYPFFEFIHSRRIEDSTEIIFRMLNFMKKRIYLNGKHPNDARENLQSYIDQKVLGKVNDTASLSDQISSLLQYRSIIVNGTRYDNLFEVIRKITTNKAAMEDLCQYQETAIHGDLSIDNLIVSENKSFMVIDPNNENQVSANIVDYGKLYQSLHSGYEFLIQLNSCVVSKNNVRFNNHTSHMYAQLFQSLDSYLQKSLTVSEYRSILFHEAVHYCRMLTYKVNINPRTVAVYYGTAIKLFNEFLEQYEK